MGIYRKYFKRILDIIVSLLVLFISFPVISFSSILLCLNNKGKFLFFQVRPGLNGKLFKIIKLRTLNDKCDDNGELLVDKDRLTLVGGIIRKLSIDELPQLINVIKGDMSIIGPRPLLVEYLPLYNKFQMRRHEVRPGITGWAQINGRNALSWEEKFNFDVWYVDNLGLLLDIKIIILTIITIISRKGVSSPTSITMEKFNG